LAVNKGEPPSTVAELFESGQFEGKIAKSLRDTLRKMNSKDVRDGDLSLQSILEIVQAGNKMANVQLGRLQGSPILRSKSSPSKQSKHTSSIDQPSSTNAAKLRELAAKSKRNGPKTATNILPIDARMMQSVEKKPYGNGNTLRHSRAIVSISVVDQSSASNNEDAIFKYENEVDDLNASDKVDERLEPTNETNETNEVVIRAIGGDSEENGVNENVANVDVVIENYVNEDENDVNENDVYEGDTNIVGTNENEPPSGDAL
jgi:hypothetical protein